MKNRLSLLFMAVALFSFSAAAQVENYALQLGPTGIVDCGILPAFDNKDSFSVQFWMNPSPWDKDATILSIGDRFSIKLGKPGELIFDSGSGSLSASSASLKADEWSQVTLICDSGEASVIINGEKVAEGKVPPIQDSGLKNPLKIGGGFRGKIDEIRIWDEALNEDMKTFDYFTNNTLNKYCPMWDNLVVYYKMDQPKCDNLVDYKSLERDIAAYNNHGVFQGEVGKVKALNSRMPYLINSAYTENARFYRSVIPRDQYLLSNELIILGTDVYAEDGRVETKTPNNHALSIANVKYEPEYNGRTGVASFGKNNAGYLELPAATLKDADNFTFETLLSIDEWVPGASLLKKNGTESSSAIDIFLGQDASEPSIIAKGDGYMIEFPIAAMNPGQWNHLVVTSEKEEPSIAIYINGEKTEGKALKNDDLKNQNLVTGDGNIFIGENFVGRLDDVVIWNKSFTDGEIADYISKGIPVPGQGYPVNNDDMSSITGYYKFDDLSNLGHSYHSQDEWLNIMKSYYDGYQGIKYYISVQGTYRVREQFGDWREILDNPEKRARFAKDLAEIAKNYDGAELDLEWLEEPEQWELFSILGQEIREAMPADKEFRVSLHNNFSDYPDAGKEYVDCFTFQQYGPQHLNFSYDNFLKKVDKFINNYDSEKIMTSYSTTTSRGSEGSGVRILQGKIIDSYVPNDEDIDIFKEGDETWYYAGPLQVYKRAKHTRENNLKGIFYWVIGDDSWEENSLDGSLAKFNQAKHSSFAINANNDPLIESVTAKRD